MFFGFFNDGALDGEGSVRMFMCYSGFPLDEVRRMSLHEFIGRLSRAQVSENDRKWMPKWVAEYSSNFRQDSSQELKLNEPDVLTFLRGLRDRGVPAWQRLQATRSLDWYQSLVGKQQLVDFSPMGTKLNEIAQREKRSPEDSSATIPGEGELD